MLVTAESPAETVKAIAAACNKLVVGPKLILNFLLFFQVYQVAYVTLKAGISPRPAAWVLEKSTDGVDFSPWQYFADTDAECRKRFGLPATQGKPHYKTDDEVICTIYYSKLYPLENGEVSRRS